MGVLGEAGYALYRRLPRAVSVPMQENPEVFTTCSTGDIGRSPGYGAEVGAFVPTFARIEGPVSASELPDQPAKPDYYNIVDYEV